jgi:FkbM family methyltransferase
MATLNTFSRSPLKGVIEALELHLMDIGARGGMDEDLFPVAWATDATGFEPAPDECGRLNLVSAGPWRSTRYVPAALGGIDGQATLKIPGSGEGASLLAHNPDMVPGYGYVTLHRTLSEIPVETLTLDSACERFDLKAPDFLKIDVEGAELAILSAAPNALLHCAAVKVEVSFLEQRNHQPLMQDVLTFMNNSGFLLGEIRGVHAWRRRPLPAHPYSARWVVPYSRGIAAQCDLMFLRDPATVPTEEAALRLIIVSAVLGFFDHGVTSLRQSPALEARLNEQVKGSFLDELGVVSRRMGRAVAMTEIRSSFRTLVPLVRSLIHGIPQHSPIYPGY